MNLRQDNEFLLHPKDGEPVANKDLADGFEFCPVARSYLRAIQPVWRIFPAFHAVHIPIVWSARESFKTSWKKLGEVWKTKVRSGKRAQFSIGRADALLFYSSAKPNWQPATEALAETLAESGKTVALCTSDKLETLRWEGNRIVREHVPDFSPVLQHGVGVTQSTIGFVVSLLEAVFLYVLLALRDRNLWRVICRNPAHLWLQLLLSNHRFQVANRLIAQVQPQMILTNGEHIPFAAELTLAKKGRRAQHVAFFNENTTPNIGLLASDEIWVWNDTVAKALEKNLLPGERITTRVMGRAEIDFACMKPKEVSVEEKELRQRASGKNVLLFLADSIPGDEIELLNEEALRWIASAAKAMPNWMFIFKSRPFHHGKEMKGLHLIRDLPNCVIPRTEITLQNFLDWENIRAVTACSSTALMVSAARGKVALRFLASKRITSLPATDEVSIAVHSLEQLIQVLKQFEIVQSSYLSLIQQRMAQFFPYQGKVIERMLDLALGTLSSSTAQVRNLTTKPRVVIALLAYNGERYIRKAIESLLRQSYQDFELLIFDDHSSDSSFEIAREYERNDERVRCFRNSSRLGLVGNSRHAFHTASGADYFAWAADHDIHHPEWLATMVRELNLNSNVVLAYPQRLVIDEFDQVISSSPTLFETVGLDARQRFAKLKTEGVGFGNMIYGLFRASALRRAGVFPAQIFPDSLLLARLTLSGMIRQVPENLWLRRFNQPFSPEIIRRQERTLFAHRPWYIAIPWPICHYVYLFYHTVLKLNCGGLNDRCLGLALCNAYWRRFIFKIRSSYPHYFEFYRKLKRAS